jgi:hypothetical protein
MNLLSLCDPAYEAQAKLVGNMLANMIMPLYHLSLKHTVFLIPLVIVSIITVPIFLALIAWMVHPIVGIFAVLMMIGSFLNHNDKENLKKSGKWTAQDETNERLNDMEWSNIIMQKQVIDQLKVIAQNSAKK